MRSLPPVIEISKPLAPFIEASSISGLDIAASAAVSALLARRFAGTHHRLAHLAHDGAYIGKIKIDQAFLDHQVGDAGNAWIQDLVGHGEGIGKGGFFVGDPEEVLIRDDQQGIDHLLQFDDAGFGKAHAPLTFEMKRLGDHADRQNTEFSRDLGNDRRGACTGAAPMPAVTNTMCAPVR